MVSFARHGRLDRFLYLSSWMFHCFIACALFLADFTACTSLPFSSYSNFFENVSLFPNNSNIVGSVNPGVLNLYTLEAQTCAAESMALVVALESSPVNIPISENFENVEYLLAINTEGHNISSDSDNDTIVASTGIRNSDLDSCTPFTQVEQKVTCRQSYAFLKIQLTKANLNTLPWYVGVSSMGSILNYTLKAWCLDGGALSEPSKPCASVGTAGCYDVREKLVCAAENIPLSSHQSSVQVSGISLQSGEWKYYTFNVSDQTRILVEMSRSHGDVMLFLKPGDSEHTQEALPSEFEIDQYGDKLGYESRQNYHHYFFIGEGLFFIGIYNNDACVEEPSLINISISTASLNSSSCLCPRNCSYPNGQCISDIVCQCEDGYGGDFCEGSFESPSSKQKISGWLSPGQVAYFKINDPKLHDQSNVSIKFSFNGSNTILLAKTGGFPTLANYSLAFSGYDSLKTLADFLKEYQISREAFQGKELIFAVFNLDYILHQSSFYNIVIILPGGKSLSTGLILVIAISSSLVFCFAMAALKSTLHRNTSRNIDHQLSSFNFNTVGENVLNRESGLEKTIIDSFPLIRFEETEFPKEEAQCPICLGEYVAGEILRKIPVCGHIFHVSCIDKWLASNRTCPVCRVILVR